jgi:hypothetical protein
MASAVYGCDVGLGFGSLNERSTASFTSVETG